MKKTALILLFLCFSVAAFAFSSAPAPKKAEEFKLWDLSGNAVSLDSYKGKSVLLVFFDTWCPYCRDEMPAIESIYKKYRSNKFNVIAISIKEDVDTVQHFVARYKLSFPVFLDEQGDAAHFYKVRYIPRLFILSGSGEIKFSSYTLSEKDLEKEVKKELQ